MSYAFNAHFSLVLWLTHASTKENDVGVGFTVFLCCDAAPGVVDSEVVAPADAYAVATVAVGVAISCQRTSTSSNCRAC